MRYTIQTGTVDGRTFIVFANPSDAQDLAVTLDIGTYSFDGYENALLLTDYVTKSMALLNALPQAAAALVMTTNLVERAAQRGETPPSWSFHERDMARENGSAAMRALASLRQAARQHLYHWNEHNPRDPGL